MTPIGPLPCSIEGALLSNFPENDLNLCLASTTSTPTSKSIEAKVRRVGEIDVLVIFGDRAIVLQAKSKRLTLEARKGNDNQIKSDFKKSVQEAYDQGVSCAELLGDPKLKFIDATGHIVRIPQRLKNVYILCVVSDNYPALSFQTRQFLKSRATDVIRPPFVMDIFTLDVMTEMLNSPLYFLSYLEKRTGYSDKLISISQNS